MLTHSFLNNGSISQNSTHKTHTQHTKRHTHLAKANTSLKTVLTFQKIVFLHSNSTHKHKIISHIHAKQHTDVKHVKHYCRVSFACSECREEQEFVIALSHTEHAHIHCICMSDEFYTVTQLNWINTELTWAVEWTIDLLELLYSRMWMVPCGIWVNGSTKWASSITFSDSKQF